MGFKIKSVLNCNQALHDSKIFFMDIVRDGMPEAKPGQFILIRTDRSCMPRPFSVYRVDDYAISIMFRVVGKNTKLLSKLRNGDKLYVSGPHGKPIKFGSREKNYILVGGGMGTAGLLLPARELRNRKINVSVLIGTKTFMHNEMNYHFEECGCKANSISEEGDKKSGLVTDLLRRHLKKCDGKPTIIACGPKPMLKAVAEIAEKNGNKCLVVLEEMMACGVGSCKSCAIFGKKNKVKHVCTDGPAFNAKWIDWEKFLPKVNFPTIIRSRKSDNPMGVVLKRYEKRKLVLKYPTMNGSGCLDIDAIENGHVDISHLGALVTKGFMFDSKTGNPTPRVCETTDGMMNSIGLENIGVKRFVEEQLPRWLAHKKPVIANISGYSVEEYGKTAERLKNTGISGIEVNISCPNIKQDKTIFGLHPEKTSEIVNIVREAAPDMFLIVKLSSMASDIVEIAESAIFGGADALSLINTPLGMAIDVWTRKFKIANKMGGMSGKNIKPLALRMVYQLAAANLGVPIIGMGGISSGDDAMEFILAGANCISVGTELFRTPDIFSKINDDLKKFMDYYQVNNVQDLVGKVAI